MLCAVGPLIDIDDNTFRSVRLELSFIVPAYSVLSVELLALAFLPFSLVVRFPRLI